MYAYLVNRNSVPQKKYKVQKFQKLKNIILRTLIPFTSLSLYNLNKFKK